MTPAAGILEQTNQKLAELKQKNPQLDLDPLTGEHQLEQKAVDRRRQADADFAATMARPRGPGATLGAVTGGLLAGTADPISFNLAWPRGCPGGKSSGILATSLGGGAASSAARKPYKRSPTGAHSGGKCSQAI